MNFLDAWTTLDPLAMARWLTPAVCIALSLILPGRGIARVAAIGVAIALPFLPEPGPWPRVAGWCVLWIAAGWLAGRASGAQPPRPRSALLGGIESSVVGLAVGLALLVLVMAALARADLGRDADRRATVALLVLVAGLTHLGLRRRARRAALSFAALGLGLQLLEDAARIAEGPGAAPPSALPLVGTALALALVERLSAAREAAVGSDRIALAHDLRD